MLRVALILMLMSLNFSCALPGPFNDFSTHYTQILSPLAWSKDGGYLYLSYVNRDDQVEFNYYQLKINISSQKYDFLYQTSRIIPSFIAADTDKNKLYLSRQIEGSIVEIENGGESILLKSDTLRPISGNFFQGKLITYKTVEHTGEILDTRNWFTYEPESNSTAEIQQNPIVIENFQDLSPFAKKAYISKIPPSKRPSPLLEQKHAYGDFDPNNATLTNLQLLPDYQPTNGYLRFWDWLSEDEILFSVIDERRRHLRSVSYTLSTQAYRIRPEFSQEGVLSPQRDRVAFVKGGFLIISNPDGTNPQRILNISRDLPKGDPEFLE